MKTILIFMIVCLCEAVSDRELNSAISEGYNSVQAIANKTGAGTGCGCCRETIQKLCQQRRTRTPQHRLLPLVCADALA